MVKPFVPAILRQKVKVLVDLHLRTADVLRLNQELHALNAGLERRVVERTHALARSNQELAQFAAVASHDLQEPLRTLAAYLQLLAKSNPGRFSADDQENFDVVLSSARRMRQLINDLLAFSQIGVDGRRLESVDCQALAESALRQLQGMVDERGAKVSIHGLPTLTAEAGLLGQVLQNLMANAIKFQPGPAPTVDVSARLEDGYWVFAVKDAGIGIDPEHNEKVFRLFGRLNSRDAYPGNGLGLSLCKKVVERHGGEIWLESAAGQGSTFYFSIPQRG
jgi:light-regulated signal transduction histidine kinase (bacteriophytochrome)